MDGRKALELKFYEILDNTNVYFQPAGNVHMKYPCIVFRLDGLYDEKADNKSYYRQRRYLVQHIFKDLKNEKINEFLDMFKLISYETRFTADDLYHDQYVLYW